MKTQKFDKAYANANKLQIGSEFDYLGETHIVDHLDSRIIASPAFSQKVIKLTPHEFDAYVYYGFIILK